MFEPNAEYRFEEEELLIRDSVREMRVRLAPKLEAFHRLRGDVWCAAEPDVRLLFPPPSEDAPVSLREEVLLQLRAQLPEQHAQLLEKFRWGQWRCILFLTRFEDLAVPLFSHNPAFAHLFANQACDPLTIDQPITRTRIQNLLERPQIEALSYLKIARKPSSIKLLKKWDICFLDRLTGTRLHFLDTHEDAARAARHLPKINAGSYQILRDPKTRRCVSAGLLRTIANSEEESEFPFCYTLLSELIELHERYPQLERLPECMNRRERIDTLMLTAQHMQRGEQEREREIREQLQADEEERARIARERQRRYREIDAMPFPPPPISGTDTIIPITSKKELAMEGGSMRHCVATYDRQIKGGYVYIYQVLAPQRATLSIVRGSDRYWRVAQLKLERNKRPSRETYHVAHKWIREHYLSVGRR